MPFSLGFTADAAAAHRHEFSHRKETEAPPSMFRVSQSLGFPKPKDGHGAQLPLSPTPLIITSRPSQTDLNSSSGEEDEDQEGANTKPTIKSYAQSRQGPNRPKTVFQFAHPVASRRRLKLRPKLLLQLHESNRSSRPFPKYDVLPSDMTTKLACRLSKPLGNIRAFGSKDLVIVTSDMYEQPATSDDRSVSSDENCVEQREVVAAICHSGSSDDFPRGGQVEIALNSGVCWTGTPLSNGSYELVSTNGIAGSRKIRWVARDKKPRQESAMSASTPGRFTFSVISPNSRRHPVIASMTRKGLTVFDQYSYPTALTEDELSPPGSPSTASAQSSAESGLIDTDEELRQLIVMTGIWVAFSEGWSTKPLTNAESPTPARTESPLSPRMRSSTYLSADGGSVSGGEKHIGTTTPRTVSRMNSLTRKKIRNRRSTYSEVGGDRLSENEMQSITPRRSKSLTSTDRNMQWTNTDIDKAIQNNKRDDPVRRDTDETNEEEETSKAKHKKWRKLSSIFGLKRH